MTDRRYADPAGDGAQRASHAENGALARAASLIAVRLDGMGDVLMTTPALKALKQGAKGRTLTLLCSPAGSAIARDLPFVDDVVVLRAPWVKDDRPATAAELATTVAALRDRAFDAAVLFTVYTQNPLPAALMLYLAGIPLRAAYCRENPYGLLTHWLPDPDRDPVAGVRHEVRRQLDLVASLGTPVRDTSLAYPIAEPARTRSEAKARAAGADPARPWLVVHPGATAASRRYPIARLAEAVAVLDRDDRLQLVVAGGPGDGDAVRVLAGAAPRAAVLDDALTLPELAALLARARVALCNNSGPAHLAAAVGTPVVDLYALTNPQHTPWGVPHRVLNRDVPCRWCLKSVCPQGHQRCLADVRPDEVVRAVRELAGLVPLVPIVTAPARAALTS